MAEAPSSKIDHLGIYAPPDQFEKLIEWYLSALSPLNYREIMRIPGAVGLGDQVPDFWIAEKEGAGPQQVHFAFTAPDRETVDAFHKAALLAGGKCNGPPGLRPEYHESYYGAFVLDPLGNNVEMVNHGNMKCLKA
ncbi:Glyoxalase/Bleomycin resistance protein/Dihydroxybiphenyl dioxygenase [Aspergillus leporis]|uniref:Glyoxalase/Bleomycin resistance protein/Dihydroxybiphenyl dioxygenase n=1 Tax=Aspergillus leporis TaxID=41062 RepID=A0A5N5X5S9_9EURO|nr:Glyoxalase/Bleomycin resistance protein/Dihydroxybiphenyl dioxygenase [Aspergillus leporis]